MKLKHTKLQIILEIIGAVLLIGMIVFIASKWSSLPNMIPGHYNAAGQVNRWGNKNEILYMPISTVMLYILLTVISFFPSVWNVPVKLTEQNKTPIYQCLKNLIIFLKIEIVCVFFYITYNDASLKNLPAAFLPVVLIVIFVTLAYFITRLMRITKKYGSDD